ncbi:MAG TPA: hypothetical protein QF455_02335, partial [Phycisphaerales bacterium]|nr:hypothetical protein [Phycisphaerales bacterium]
PDPPPMMIGPCGLAINRSTPPKSTAGNRSIPVAGLVIHVSNRGSQSARIAKRDTLSPPRPWAGGAIHTVELFAAIAWGGPANIRSDVNRSASAEVLITQSDVVVSSSGDFPTNHNTSPRAAGGGTHI